MKKIIIPDINSSQESLNQLLFELVDRINAMYDSNNNLLETQALEFEYRKHKGPHTHKTDGVCRVCENNELWQQAADYLRAQKITE